MKHLCLVYFEPAKLAALSKSEGIALTNESIAYDEAIGRSGQYIASQALQPADMAVTVRVRDGRIATTDGPFAETKEVLGGFVLIEARDRAEAIRIAAGIPLARIGSIEVRPILQLERNAVPVDPGAGRTTKERN